MKLKINLTYTFLIIVICLSLIYLIYINNKENKQLENFNNNSLSSYYQNNIDDDSVVNDIEKNKIDSTTNNIFKKSIWNGVYTYDDSFKGKHMCVMIQINKHIIFSLTKMDYVIYTNNNNKSTDLFEKKKKKKKSCPPYTFIGIGELNDNETLFYLKEIYCNDNNTFKINDKKPEINKMTANFNNNQIEFTLFNNHKTTLNKEEDLNYNSSAVYLLLSSYNVPAPILKNSVNFNSDICENSYFNTTNNLKKCYIKGIGLPYQKNDGGWNPYGTGCSTLVTKENGINTCSNTINNTCFLPINNTKSVTNYEGIKYNECKTDFKIRVKDKTSVLQPFYETNGNVLDLCKNLSHFKDERYNAAILMYVDNLYNVQTLSYNFFGVQDNNSHLTTKYDIMFPFMNDFILKKYRNALTDVNTKNSLLESSLNLTNCLNKNQNQKDYNKLIESCKNRYDKSNRYYKSMISDLKINQSKYDFNTLIDNNNKLNKVNMPNVWKLNFNTPSDYTNSCSFSLSSSSFYEKESQFVKYPEFYPMEGKTKMGLFKDSNNQKLVLENAYVIDSSDNYLPSSVDSENISNDFILLSGNLKTNQPKKYLLPGNNSNSLNNFGNEIYLSDKLKTNGKWLVMGINLTNNLNNGSSLNYNNTTLIKTLNKIKNVVNTN